MQVSLFGIIMTIMWSSLLIVVLYFFRKKLLFLEVCSVTGVISTYMFCALRLLLPIEVPWTRVINGGPLWNGIQKCIGYEIIYLRNLSIMVGDVLLTIWIVIAICKCIKIFISYDRFNKMIDKMPREKCENQMAISAGVQVYKSEAINNPCAVGIRKKIILIPNRNYSEQQEKYIIMHEIAHCKNRDILIKLFINVLCALYWWNPLVYLLKKDINQSLEIRCDQVVTQFLEDDKKAEYLSIILEEFKNSLGETKNQNEYIMEFLGCGEDSLVERFKFVANGRYCTSMWKRIIIAVSVFVIFIASYSFVIQSSFDVPARDIEDGTYLFDDSNSFIMKQGDGTYSLVTPYEIIRLNEEEIEFYLNNGFSLEEE